MSPSGSFRLGPGPLRCVIARKASGDLVTSGDAECGGVAAGYVRSMGRVGAGAGRHASDVSSLGHCALRWEGCTFPA